MNMDDFTCAYSKHNCELRAEHKSGKTRWKKCPFKRIFLISERNIRSYWYLRSKGAIQLEIIRQINSKHWYIVHPFAQIRLYWELFMVFVLLFSAIFLPFKSAFLNPLVAKYYISQGRSLDSFNNAFLIDFCLNLIWILDSLGNFFTGYYDANLDKVIMDPATIVHRYLVPGFILDVTSTVPFEAVFLFALSLEVYARINQAGFIIVQMYNLYSIVRFRYYIRYCYKISRLGYMSDLTLRILLSFLVYTWIINWSIYVSLIVPQMVYGSSLFRKSGNQTLCWAQYANLFEMSLMDQYKTALLKSLLTNIGVSRWNEMFATDDYIMSVIISILGRIYWIYILVWFLEAITAANILRVNFHLILHQLKTYMKQKEVPLFLKKRLNRFYFYRFQAHYFRDRAILGRLTESLRKEISVYTCQKLIHNTEVFQSLPKRVVARLVQSMNREMYFPNDVIIRANTFGECMYFICSGTVTVSTASDKHICELEDGDFFGEIALIIEDSRRTATVTAVTITELYRLDSSDFKKIIEMYPDVYYQLEKFAAARFRMLVSIEERPIN